MLIAPHTGPVQDVRLVRDRRTNRSKGVGYIEFVDVDSAQKALQCAGEELCVCVFVCVCVCACVVVVAY